MVASRICAAMERRLRRSDHGRSVECGCRGRKRCPVLYLAKFPNELASELTGNVQTRNLAPLDLQQLGLRCPRARYFSIACEIPPQAKIDPGKSDTDQQTRQALPTKSPCWIMWGLLLSPAISIGAYKKRKHEQHASMLSDIRGGRVRRWCEPESLDSNTEQNRTF